MKEFAQKGYANASTNEIVKEAGIAKGLLFHYFKNKKQLFLFLYDYFVDLCMEEFYGKINLEETDFFVKLREVQKIKLELLNKHPEIFTFLEAAHFETSSEVIDDLKARNDELRTISIGKIFENIDPSKFKEGIDLARVINIIFWTFEGFGTAELRKAKLNPSHQLDYEKLFAEADVYTEMLKNCFYK